MLDDGTGIVRRKKVRRTTAERAGIVAETHPDCVKTQILASFGAAGF
jgi:hypothetical protein